jgi:hypothetical protein
MCRPGSEDPLLAEIKKLNKTEQTELTNFYHCPLVKRGRDQHMAILLSFFSPSPSPVIYWTNQSKADSAMLFCDWLTKLRPPWRQVAVNCSANS